MAWLAARGIIIEQVVPDTGAAYRPRAWRDTCAELGITVKKTRPYRTQANGKTAGFHRTRTRTRTLAGAWAYARFYNLENIRRNALSDWLHHYSHHRPQIAIGDVAP